MILRNNARHPENPKPLPEWITEALKRPLLASKTERTYIYDVEYRCDPWIDPTLYGNNKLSFKIQIPNPQTQPNEMPQFPPPPSPILKNSETSQIVPVTVTSTPINANDIICIEDKTLWPQKSGEQTIDSSSPPPPQTAPATAMTAPTTQKRNAQHHYPKT